MTDNVNKFKKATVAVEKNAKYKKGIIAVNLANEFGKRGIDVVHHQNENKQFVLVRYLRGRLCPRKFFISNQN